MRTMAIAMCAALAAACGSTTSQQGGGGEGDPNIGKVVHDDHVTVPAPTAQQKLDDIAETFYWAYMDANPADAVDNGYHQYDGRLPNASPDALAAYVAMLKKTKAAIESLPAAELTRTGQIEREVLLSEIRGELFDLETLRMPSRSPIGYMWSINVADYIARDYAPLADRAQGIIGVCDGAGDYLSQAMENLEPKIPRTWLGISLLQTNGLIEFINDDVAKEMKGLDEQTLAKLKASLGRCVNALSEYRDFLQDRMKDATDDFALGEQLFLQMIRDKEGLDISIERLDEIGKADLERNLAAMTAAANKVNAKKPVAKVIAQVARDKPKADKVLDLAREQSAKMRQFLIDEKIVTIPSEDVAEVRESPPFMRWNFAFLSSAGAFEDKPLPSFYYISPPDPKWPKAEQKAYIPFRSDLLFTTIHELWPGHFLHALHAKQNPSKVLKTFCSYAMSEGWAHYTEEMMLEAGVGAGDPKVQIGELTNALLRNARFVSAIGLHARGMTVDESIELFQTKAFSDKGTAKQQAVRGTFDAGYLNYTLGKLMIRKLRDDWKAKVGDDYSLQAFHDEFLSYGCAPIPVIRNFMLENDTPAL
jgi:uncharacterized protein (DUF885 family)